MAAAGCRAEAGTYEVDEIWAAALTTLGVLTPQRGDYAQGLAHIQESGRILESSDDLLRRSLVLNWLDIVALNTGDAQRAEALFAENREIALALNFPWDATTELGSIADSLVAPSRLDEADTTAAEAASGFRDLHDPYGVGRMEAILASVAWLRGNYETAHQHG